MIICLVFIQNFILINTKTICYTDYGCFSDEKPFYNPGVRPWALTLLPQEPSKISTKYLLFTRNNINTSVYITSQNESEYFKVNFKTTFIIHGFLVRKISNWLIELKDSLLKFEDMNVIIVDWTKGNSFPYSQATANTQVVGRDIAKLVNSFISKNLITANNIHLIGHSLGAHVAGYAGEQVQGLGRITGLDPAGPLFEFSDNKVRLDPSDANFVDVIHTDGASTSELGFGLIQSSGTVDFYVNGGRDQPGCPKRVRKLVNAILYVASFGFKWFEDSMKAVTCSHSAAIRLYINSIEREECSYLAIKCENSTEFNNSNCKQCSSERCYRISHFASEKNELGNLYLNTNDDKILPPCYNLFYKNKSIVHKYAVFLLIWLIFAILLSSI